MKGCDELVNVPKIFGHNSSASLSGRHRLRMSGKDFAVIDSLRLLVATLTAYSSKFALSMLPCVIIARIRALHSWQRFCRPRRSSAIDSSASFAWIKCRISAVSACVKSCAKPASPGCCSIRVSFCILQNNQLTLALMRAWSLASIYDNKTNAGGRLLTFFIALFISVCSCVLFGADIAAPIGASIIGLSLYSAEVSSHENEVC